MRNGHPQQRVSNIANLSFAFVEGEALLLRWTPGDRCSTASACSAGSTEPSHVLTAIGVDPLLAEGAIRFSLGRTNTGAEIDYVIDSVAEAVTRLRELSPLAGRAQRAERRSTGMTGRVVVAFRRGRFVVAALLLQRRGFDVIGVTLRLAPAVGVDGSRHRAVAPPARRTRGRSLRRSGFLLRVELRASFEETGIAPFCAAYSLGRTPNPCVDCNAHIKFGKLLRTALAVGADCVATGH